MDRLNRMVSSRRRSYGEGWREVWVDNISKGRRFRSNRVINSKYTILTFFPKNLMEQFGRFMNRYFLLIACLQLIPSLTPISPATTWAPLIIIFLISAAKEALDDVKRHQADQIANSREYTIIRNGYTLVAKSKHIRVGDIVRIEGNSEIPCDMVVLESSETDGICYIQTSSLDGETDLKERFVPPEVPIGDLTRLARKRMRIQCPHPNNHIYAFDATLTVDVAGSTKVYSLDTTNLVLQGTFLRNTQHIFGTVVYTGKETKLGMNKTKPATKVTALDKQIDFACGVIFGLQLTLVLLLGIAGTGLAEREFFNRHSYIGMEDEFGEWYHYFLIPGRMLLLLSFMIPISLKVSLDIVKYMTAQFINWDVRMYYPVNDQPAEAANTAVAEDLGQIQYVFSDKTGTLTENSMRLKGVALRDSVFYADPKSRDISGDTKLSQKILAADGQSAVGLLTAAALCHTVLPDPDNAPVFYRGSSPDEEAIVSVAASFGFVFKNKNGCHLDVNFQGENRRYELLKMLEFTSDRKRMSVIVRNMKTSEIFLFMKGADDVVTNSCVDPDNVRLISKSVDDFADVGFRTLCFAFRQLTEQEYREWEVAYSSASTSLQDREMKVLASYRQIESELHLLGATAIEDSLQEIVPETIALLRSAGLKIWMLTGDKRGTAVQIGRSCNLIMDDTSERVIHLDSSCGSYVDVQRKIDALLDQYRPEGKNESTGSFVLVVDGSTLKTIFEDKQCVSGFVNLSLHARSVICCRVSPYQKSAVVSLIKDRGKVTLAIGDGGNDVAMIQKAHIGVGIKGKEGFQAARAADYTIARFNFLARLLLIHGRYSYKRTAFVAFYCIYKSMFIGLLQGLFETACGFSGTSFFSSYALTTYNVFFTGLPVVFFFLDKDISEASVFRYPDVYAENISGVFFNSWLLFGWIAQAFFQSTITFKFAIEAFSDNITSSMGPSIDLSTTSMLAFTTTVLLMNLVVLLSSNSVTVLNQILIWGSIVFYFCVTLLSSFIIDADPFGIIERMFVNPTFWFAVVVILTTCLVPKFLHSFVCYNFFPKYYQLIQKQEKKGKGASIA